jgi:hypothetical protein
MVGSLGAASGSSNQSPAARPRRVAQTPRRVPTLAASTWRFSALSTPAGRRQIGRARFQLIQKLRRQNARLRTIVAAAIAKRLRAIFVVAPRQLLKPALRHTRRRGHICERAPCERAPLRQKADRLKMSRRTNIPALAITSAQILNAQMIHNPRHDRIHES